MKGEAGAAFSLRLRESLGWCAGGQKGLPKGRAAQEMPPPTTGHTGTSYSPASVPCVQPRHLFSEKGALEMMGREGRERVGDGDVGMRSVLMEKAGEGRSAFNKQVLHSLGVGEVAHHSSF